MTEAAEQQLALLITGLTQEVHKLSERFRRSHTANIIMGAAVTVSLLLGIAVGFIAVRTNSAFDCIQTWAVASGTRTQNLITLSNKRNDADDAQSLALTAALKAAIAGDAKDLPKLETAWLKASALAATASANYTTAQKNNPSPAPPYGCSTLF